MIPLGFPARHRIYCSTLQYSYAFPAQCTLLAQCFLPFRIILLEAVGSWYLQALSFQVQIVRSPILVEVSIRLYHTCCQNTQSLPRTKRWKKTSLEMINRKKPDIDFSRMIYLLGCSYITKELRKKLDQKSQSWIVIGWKANSTSPKWLGTRPKRKISSPLALEMVLSTMKLQSW